MLGLLGGGRFTHLVRFSLLLVGAGLEGLNLPKYNQNHGASSEVVKIATSTSFGPPKTHGKLKGFRALKIWVINGLLTTMFL